MNLQCTGAPSEIPPQTPSDLSTALSNSDAHPMPHNHQPFLLLCILPIGPGTHRLLCRLSRPTSSHRPLALVDLILKVCPSERASVSSLSDQSAASWCPSQHLTFPGLSAGLTASAGSTLSSAARSRLSLALPPLSLLLGWRDFYQQERGEGQYPTVTWSGTRTGVVGRKTNLTESPLL